MSQLKESRFDVLSFVAAGEELPVKLEKEKPVREWAGKRC